MNAAYEHSVLLTVLFLLGGISVTGGRSARGDEPPVADAGPSRYAAQQPVQLDGTKSHDPDNSGPLTYTWTQVSGPPLVITGATTATPTLSGFVQTQQIQECQFQLLINDGQQAGFPDTVKVVIVPDFRPNTLKLENASFDPNKPTVIFFGGGDCVAGPPGQVWSTWANGAAWLGRANIIGFPDGYAPDTTGVPRTYYKYGDLIITYLSAVAPNYGQPIQTMGFSTGGQPAVDVGLRLNLTYRDARYAVNRVTFCDATPYCRNYSESIKSYLASAVDGEQCWIDNYVGQSNTLSFPDVLNVSSALSHLDVPAWYSNSLSGGGMNRFNNGVVAGAYWSVCGPGKNLQLASTPDAQRYRFRWIGSATTGQMEFYDQPRNPGRLPEPVTLGAWVNLSEVSGDIDGAVLSCRESENAVGYQLLLGSDPYRVMDYRVVSDTPLPPTDVIRDFPSGQTWWTIRVRDQYGSTIHADPIRLDLTTLRALSVKNARTGKKYGFISRAIRDACSGDVILLDPTIYDESIEFGGKTLAVRSLDPNNPEVVAGTIIRGWDASPTVTFAGPESGGCGLAGLTIHSETVGVSCRDAVPTIRNCVVESPDGIAIEFWWGCEPNLIDCTILGQVKEVGLIAHWRLDEGQGAIAADSAGTNNATLMGDPLWQPAGGKIGGAVQFDGIDDSIRTPFILDPAAESFSVFAWIKGGGSGQVILSQTGGANWLMASSPDGLLMTDLKCLGRQVKSLTSTTVITDGDWHHVGLLWDGSNRVLYIDDIEAKRDTQGLPPSSEGGLNIGAGSTLAAGTFWSGLIDDVRIYDKPIKP